MSVERTFDLLADRAVQPLEPSELRELEQLLATHPELDDDSFDLAAAAFDLAFGPLEPEPLPAALSARLRARGEELVGAGRASRSEVAPAVAPPIVTAARPAQPEPRDRIATPPILPWFVAAAATLLALLGWLRSDTAPATVDVASARELLIGEARDLVRHEWGPAGDPTGESARGDVIWSDRRQEGYMTFEGLPANDPTAEQYQLWIFDKNQSTDTPVDGGVFDVPRGAGRVVLPIDAKLEVGEGFAFAITVEKPGGVVVSSRERLALIAGL